MTLGPGVQLGAYRILALLGSGGMGEVYRARDERLGREVALKILPLDSAVDAARLSRFEQEARLASALNHPNIVTIYEFGHVDDTRFIAMEVVDGQTLREVIGTAPSPRRILDVAVQAADGLAKAHAAGIVHRDLKPTNMMLSRDGFVKILDFGLSKLTRALPEELGEAETRLAPALTHEGSILGTVDYMSPEQAAGRAADARADQFSLGLALYELATGTHPFRRKTAVQTLAAILEDQPEPPGALNPRLPPAFCRIVERCLAKDPGDRYESTRDLARDLLGAREGMTDARSSAVTLARPRVARRWLAATGGGVALATVVVLVPLVAPDDIRWWFQPLPERKQVVVLPFAVSGGSSPDQYVFAGLAGGLAAGLSMLEQANPSLRVVPNAEVTGRQVASVGETLGAFGASLALKGEAERSGTAWRLRLDVVDTRTQRALRTLQTGAGAVTLTGLMPRVTRLLGLASSDPPGGLADSDDAEAPEVEDDYLRGLGYLQREGGVEAVDNAALLFRQALSSDPANARAAAALCEAERRRYVLTADERSLDDAAVNCNRAITLTDGIPQSHVSLGLVHLSAGKPAEAIDEFRRALDVDPVNADALRELAGAYAAQGYRPEAEARYREAIKARPSDWTAYNALGVFYYRNGQLEEAEAQFRTVIRMVPDNIRGYSNLGGLYQLLDRYAEATEMLERAMVIAIRYGSQQSYIAASNLGTVYFYQARYADAARLFERAKAINDTDYRLWRNLAATYNWLPGAQDQMRQAYGRAVELADGALAVSPDDAGLQMALADCYSMLGQSARARDHLRRALDLAPSDVGLMFTAANVYEQLGERDRAIAAVRTAVAGGYSLDRVRRSPTLADLRADPRVASLMRQ